MIGCSLTFEAALIAAGVSLLVVSMRPLRQADVGRAIEITAGFSDMHGAPIYHREGSALGIADPMQPDYREAVDTRPGEVPVFWACRVTSQVPAEAVRPLFFITHAPGEMRVTNRLR